MGDITLKDKLEQLKFARKGRERKPSRATKKPLPVCEDIYEVCFWCLKESKVEKRKKKYCSEECRIEKNLAYKKMRTAYLDNHFPEKSKFWWIGG